MIIKHIDHEESILLNATQGNFYVRRLLLKFWLNSVREISVILVGQFLFLAILAGYILVVCFALGYKLTCSCIP